MWATPHKAIALRRNSALQKRKRLSDMNNASPRRFPSSFPAVRGGGLAPMNVLNVEVEDTEPPRSPRENPAGDFTGFFIALGLAIPAGLFVYACVITVWILL
jgi:hypothetical protein